VGAPREPAWPEGHADRSADQVELVP